MIPRSRGVDSPWQINEANGGFCVLWLGRNTRVFDGQSPSCFASLVPHNKSCQEVLYDRLCSSCVIMNVDLRIVRYGEQYNNTSRLFHGSKDNIAISSIFEVENLLSYLFKTLPILPPQWRCIFPSISLPHAPDPAVPCPGKLCPRLAVYRSHDSNCSLSWPKHSTSAQSFSHTLHSIIGLWLEIHIKHLGSRKTAISLDSS
jgi:hypothetical protein